MLDAKVVRGMLLKLDNFIVIVKMRIRIRLVHKPRWIKKKEMRVAMERLNEQKMRLEYQKEVEERMAESGDR